MVSLLPQAFKIIPNLKNWEEVLYLTDPDSWSPHAMYAATRMFVSNLNARLAQVTAGDWLLYCCWGSVRRPCQWSGLWSMACMVEGWGRHVVQGHLGKGVKP